MLTADKQAVHIENLINISNTYKIHFQLTLLTKKPQYA